MLAGIQEYPWQTDTSIGDWYHNKNWKFRGADWVLHTLIDVVSKNGNLLINVVQRPDGSLDPAAETVLVDMADWMKVNSESIYGTRPWLVFGEGPVRAKGGAFKEDFGFSAKDVRYVQKGDAIYATFMGRPGAAETTLLSLSKHAGDTATITNVTLLGAKQPVVWSHDAKGLHVVLPQGAMSDIAVVLKIKGKDLRGFHSIPVPEAEAVVADQSGDYHLIAALAETHGSNVNTEQRDGQTNLGFWDSPEDWVSWPVEFQKPGTFDVFATVALPERTTLEIKLGDVSHKLTLEPTGDWGRFVEVPVGQFEIGTAGLATVRARPADKAAWKPLNLRGLTFRRRH